MLVLFDGVKLLLSKAVLLVASALELLSRFDLRLVRDGQVDEWGRVETERLRHLDEVQRVDVVDLL